MWVNGSKYSRKLFEPISTTDATVRETSWEPDVVIILSALLFALVCVLFFGSMLRCALRHSRLLVSRSLVDVVGNAGMKDEAVKAIPIVKYVEGVRFFGNQVDCPICLAEFVKGEELRVLPTCNHGFHVGCIDAWLIAHSSCPSCRQKLVQVEKKINVKIEGSEHHFLP